MEGFISPSLQAYKSSENSDLEAFTSLYSFFYPLGIHREANSFSPPNDLERVQSFNTKE